MVNIVLHKSGISLLLLVCGCQEVGGEPGLGKGGPVDPVKQGL